MDTTSRVDYLTKEETERFFQAIPRERVEDRLLFDLIYRHGLRRREASLLRVDDLHDGRIWINALKHGHSGEFPLHPTTIALLNAYLPTRDPRSPWLLPGTGENPIAPGTIYHRFRRYAAAAGLPEGKRNVHILRHSIAVALMEDRWDIADVSDWLRHASIKNTVIYAQITNHRREANYARTLKSSNVARTDW